ncbi:MAG: asparagine synthase (glutamine-hydrolyzing) [Candidatus Zambryskibacteria bacterium]|nr:asparagine synthase (glutamine-hydrolyzing) [Candidatus Zambryskibacteria bacterium]
MCGIIGITGGKHRGLKEGMGLMHHRGPDNLGSWSNSSVAFGHCRLSIIDVSSSSNQPFVSGNGKAHIVFNGEIYNYRELRDLLKIRGVSLKTQGDTEALLEGYLNEGVDFFKRLRGMWAFAIYDESQQKLILSRDHFGIKPLYYSYHSGILAFASELRAIQTLVENLNPHTAAYHLFWNLGYFPEPYTCYEEVWSLRPSEVVVLDLEKSSLSNFMLTMLENFQREESITDEDEAVKSIELALNSSIEAHYVADVPVGLLLSGGTDSSLISALSSAQGRRPATFHISIKDSSDTAYAKSIARLLGLNLEIAHLTPQLLEEWVTKLPNILDGPTADLSVIPTSLVFSLVPKSMKVILSGDGGDEFFGGYLHHPFLNGRRLSHDHAAALLFGSLVKNQSLFALQYINPAINRLRRYWNLFDKDDLAHAYLIHSRIIDYPLKLKETLKFINDAIEHHPLKKILPVSLIPDIALYLPGDILSKVDRASMNSSIEARPPFVDQEVMRAVAKIDPRFIVSAEWQGKLILKKILERYLPYELAHRDKKGFGFSTAQYGLEFLLPDTMKAIKFHAQYAEQFDLGGILEILTPEKAAILVRKYPRFALALITNWYVFSKTQG